MAQKSIHILNKNGFSMFWGSMWDDKINYSKSLKKQIFLQNFFTYLIEDFNSINVFKRYNFFLKNYQQPNKTKKNYFFKNNFKKLSYENYFYNSKIWILKYQNWFVIFFFIYEFKKKKITKKNSLFFTSNLNNFFKNISKLNINFDMFLKKLYF